MVPAARRPAPGPLSGPESAPLPAPVKGKTCTGEQAANRDKQLSYAEMGAMYAGVVAGRPVKWANAGADSSASLSTKDRASDEGKGRRNMKKSRRAPLETKSPGWWGENVTVGTTAGGHLVTRPAAPKKPSGPLKPTANGLSSCQYQLLRRKQHSGAPLPGHSVKCPGLSAARRLAPLKQAPKWIKQFRQGSGVTEPRYTYLG
jgi:hypothetical protein